MARWPKPRRWAWLGGALVTAALCAWVALPRPQLYEGVSFGALVTDRHGRPLRLRPAADGRYRLFTPLAEIAPVVVEATLLYEDRGFRRHAGVSLPALARAAWTTYVRRARPVGGSTITMQLARLSFRLNTRSPLGKLRQMAKAVQIERHYGKDEILEAYLNLAPYGGAVEGVGAASRIYFDKPAARLGLGEGLALAVIPQNPSGRFPATAAGRDALLAARRRLLAAWKDRHPGADTLAPAPRFRSPAHLPFRAPHFVRDHVPHSDASVLATTLDLPLQGLVEARVREHVARRRREGIRNAAALLVDQDSGEVRALVGSAGFFDVDIHGQVNGVRAPRSPGSTLKPLLYGLALDAGLLHPMTLLKDAPRRYAGFAPENFDRGFVGPVFARDALIHSRNVPAVAMLARLGVGRFRDWLAAAGVAGLRPAEAYGLPLALGGNEMTMEELVRLYALLASGGRLPTLSTVPGPRAEAETRLLSREASFLVLDALRDVPRDSTPALAARAAAPVAWKTGTSFGFRDAWSVGLTRRFVLAVWVGNFDATPNPAFVGREAAAPLFFAIADSLPAGEVASTAPPPHLNLRRVAVCAPTGDLPGPHCPRTKPSWFIPGVSPIKVSTVHRAVLVDARTGLRSCRPGDDAREQVFEFWPTDLQAVFRRAGVAIRAPPPWMPECRLDTLAAVGQPPRIRSPRSTVTYHAAHAAAGPAAQAGRGEILFSASADADAQRLFWFVDDRFAGDVASGAPFYWRPSPGHFTVRVVDDAGRAAAVSIRVSG